VIAMTRAISTNRAGGEHPHARSRPESSIAPDLRSYDYILIALSGGKDSVGTFLHLIDEGVDPTRIELHHHDVDGRGPPTFDWPITAGYCRVIAESFGVPLYFSWRDGGLRREMLREGEPTASVTFETAEGSVTTVGGRGNPGTRLRFPQVTANLRLRWCSSVAKIDMMRSMICNSPRFLGKRTLVVTGERAEESPARARYLTFEPHRTDTRGGTRRPRTSIIGVRSTAWRNDKSGICSGVTASFRMSPINSALDASPACIASSPRPISWRRSDG
jgi:3'-phosphoadenosine 5'-phosphosulfate sulfotransferase (PAPS reductase)/FAD synthetase